MLLPVAAKGLTQSSKLQVQHILATDVLEVSELAAACQGFDKQLAEDMLQLTKQQSMLEDCKVYTGCVLTNDQDPDQATEPTPVGHITVLLPMCPFAVVYHQYDSGTVCSAGRSTFVECDEVIWRSNDQTFALQM